MINQTAVSGIGITANDERVLCADGSRGLVVMGGDSCSEGHGFESQHSILDGHFSHVFVVKIVMFV